MVKQLTPLTLLALSSLLLSGNSFAKKDPAFIKIGKKIFIGDYSPPDIVPFHEIEVSKRIVPDLKRLLAAAKKDGLQLKAVSGYRSYDDQIETFNRWTEREMRDNPNLTRKQAEKKANSYSARPGHSEHQLGTTVDVLSAENNYKFSSNHKLQYVGWLAQNARRFNFKISYPKNSKEYEYEPWHIRWYPRKKR